MLNVLLKMSLLQPKKWKHRKVMRGRVKWVATNGNKVDFGDYGMKALGNWYITNRQIEAARKVITKYTKKIGKIWIRVFPDMPYTSKGLEMPMGSGKWDVDAYRARIHRGKIIFEITGLKRETAEEVFRKAGNKLPFKTKMVERGELQ